MKWRGSPKWWEVVDILTRRPTSSPEEFKPLVFSSLFVQEPNPRYDTYYTKDLRSCRRTTCIRIKCDEYGGWLGVISGCGIDKIACSYGSWLPDLFGHWHWIVMHRERLTWWVEFGIAEFSKRLDSGDTRLVSANNRRNWWITEGCWSTKLRSWNELGSEWSILHQWVVVG